ncbi:DEAD/DEAH box helicase family protein [Clostridiaceae bacterium UIB06]|uniref:DEAD/DEAH box helicase family protein n=1 Tax=Clostridium thailandense TaxID=2794346 RepID=A0A949WT90_9CLOT|nr:DEAD/DEAH box helicase family protein [Clostridium thailandense]MBV7276050.1 DEAD/DEAH box helicase family protein [Clostridium thailandense]MCH5135845.1 DEAD/DEAH box helicase family protein [Clostridiaceae bacterium UIB06]
MNYIEKLNNHKEYLRNLILGDFNNPSNIKLFDLECGLGKTKTAVEVVTELYKINPNKKILFVTRFDDTVESVKNNSDFYNLIHSKINIMAKSNIAVAINKTTKYDYIPKYLEKFNVVVITHEKYKQISKYPKQVELFQKYMDILIVDEEINMVEAIKYSKKRMDWFSTVLPRWMRGRYEKVIRDIDLALSEQKEMLFLTFDINKNKEIRILKGQIKNFINDAYSRTQVKKDEKTGKDVSMVKRDFIEEVNEIYQIYNNQCIIMKNKICTYDKRIKYWLLKKNILLDANGGFNYIYRISDLFDTSTPQSKIINHSNCNLYVYNCNTTKYAKSKYKDFYEHVQEEVESIIKENDKVLVIGNKLDEKNLRFDNKNIAMNHFGNLNGKNAWKDFNKIFIIQTPNIPAEVYILKYMYYSQKIMNNKYTLYQHPENGVMKFKNEEFDKIRVSYISAELYQAIKRIQRKVNDDGLAVKADYYIINNDEGVVNLLIKQLKGINVYNLDFDVQRQERKEYDNSNRFKDSYADKFIKLLDSLDKGGYKKNWLREQIEYESKAQFSNKILNHPEVKKYMIYKNIINRGQRIIIV